MSDNEKNKLLMYKIVITFLLENKDIISYNPSFSIAISKLKDAINKIKMKDMEISSNILGKTIITSEAKEDLIFTVILVTASQNNFAKKIVLNYKKRHV
jgi:hypothetical protein